MASAVILSGLVHRSLRHVVESLREKVIAPLAKLGEMAIFYHSWDVPEITNPRTGETGRVLDPTEVTRWLPEATGIFDSQEEFDRTVDWERMFERNPMRHCTDSEEAARATLMNFRRALESQERAWRFFEKTKTRSYARVVVTRADLRFLEELGTSNIRLRVATPGRVERSTSNVEARKVWLPRFHGWGGVNDRFAMGGEEEMGIYCRRAEFADGWLLGGGQGNSEQILMKWLERNWIRTELLDFTFQRVRATGEVAAMDRELSANVMMVSGDSLILPKDLEEGTVTSLPLRERFLILARESCPASRRLQEVLAPLGLAEVIVDSPGDEGIWYPNEELDGYGGLMGFSADFPALTAWSRAMYHLSLTLRSDEAVWFVEDDVAGNFSFFETLVGKTAATCADLAAIDIRSRVADPHWHCWNLAEPWFETPVRAFEPLCRISARLIGSALEFRRVNGRFAFHEVLFASLAANHGMKVLDWFLEPGFRRLFGTYQFRPAVDSVAPGISHPVKESSIHEAICALAKTPEMVLAVGGGSRGHDREVNRWRWFEDDNEDWRRWFAVEQPVRALEIGSQNGVSANLMLKTLFTHRESEVHCIETFDTLPEQGENLRAEFMRNAKSHGHERQIELYEGTSVEILAWMIAGEGYWESFDFIYHAGAETAASLLADACQAWNLLKPGGVMVFSGAGGGASSQVRATLDAFLAAYADRLQLLRDARSVIVSKASQAPQIGQ